MSNERAFNVNLLFMFPLGFDICMYIKEMCACVLVCRGMQM